MSIAKNKEIMRRMIEEIWNKGNLAVADELFAPEHTSPSAPNLPPGSEGVKMLAKMFREAMPDYHIEIDKIVAAEDRVAARFIQSGTHTGGDLMGLKASGKKATWTEIGILRIKDGKIVESWYEVDMMSLLQQLGVIPAPGQQQKPMSTREIIDAYYKHANAGNWDAWCDLFADDMVMDEQLAGHIEGLATLRPMMAGMKKAYSKFQNVPKHIIVSGDEAAVVSHISAANAKGVPIEADVMNYFRMENGKIKYMANFHDSKPFAPFLNQQLD